MKRWGISATVVWGRPMTFPLAAAFRIPEVTRSEIMLEARAKASEKGKMKDTMERAKLKSELDNLQRLVDRIPPDILAELKRQQRHTVKER